MIDHLQKQIAFLVEADKLKTILRKTSPIHTQERKENSAEHSWQVALAACLLADYANQPIDLLRVLKMLLLHDISEIDTNDTFHYDKQIRLILRLQNCLPLREFLPFCRLNKEMNG